MPAEQGLSVPSIKVNNDIITIQANSFKFTPGDGETTVRAASAGGGSTETVHTQNAETMFSTVKFSMLNTPSNMTKVRGWKAVIGGNTLEAMQRGTGGNPDYKEAFKGLSVTNDPEVVASVDGIIEIEMAGDRIE